MSAEFSLKTLHELGLEHRADKSYYHEYTVEFYPFHLDPIRATAKKVIEIGIYSGASLAMWSDYFQNAEIIGIDFDLSRIKQVIPRVSYRYADQSSRIDLQNALYDVESDSIDLIVDDAMHSMVCQQVSLAALFRLVRPGGIYIVEDLQTSVTNPDSEPTTLDLLRCLESGEPVVSSHIYDEEMQYLQDSIDKIFIFSRTPKFDKSVSAVVYKNPVG